MKQIVPILFLVLTFSCNSQDYKQKARNSANQIAEYVVNAFEDSKGNLWFGTLREGMAMYDGKQLRYFTMADGLPSNRAVGIIENPNGTYWIGTGKGLVKYDGNSFFHFPNKDDASSMISNMFIDSKGIFWVGTWDGVYTFDGKDYKPFPIPLPAVETMINEDTKNWIKEINEDAEGNIWFAQGGYGACKYDGKNFTPVLVKDGLHSNSVTEIEFDKEGNIWFGTRVAEHDNPDPKMRKGKGGINLLTKDSIISFPVITAFNEGDVYEIYIDSSEDVWISTVRDGVYKYDGIEFIHYEVPVSIMKIIENPKGNLWLAGAGGLYRIDPSGKVINVQRSGPWN